jgi:hypothetical protein
MTWLEAIADFATIATAAIAVWAYTNYRLTLRHRTQKVEELLKRKSDPNDDTLTLEQVAAPLKLTIEQVLEAAQRSSYIEETGSVRREERRLRYIRKSN